MMCLQKNPNENERDCKNEKVKITQLRNNMYRYTSIILLIYFFLLFLSKLHLCCTQLSIDKIFIKNCSDKNIMQVADQSQKRLG